MKGITNGIDTAEWDPTMDEHIISPYSATDLSGKVDNSHCLGGSSLHLLEILLNPFNYELQAQCKIALQKELGLPVLPDCPLVDTKSPVLRL